MLTARNRPWIRTAGSPMSTATAAPTMAAAMTVTKKSWEKLAASFPAVTAPTPTMANCPRLIWPAHPVRITRETATMAAIGTRAICETSPSLTSSGANRTKAATSRPTTTRAPTTSGRFRSSRGMGRNSFSVWKLDTPLSWARLSVLRWSNREPRMKMSMMAAERSEDPVDTTELCSRMPIAMPAASARGTLSIFATTAAASANSSTV